MTGTALTLDCSVTLPTAFKIDQRQLGSICCRAELASDRYAGRQPIGEPKRNPLLESR